VPYFAGFMTGETGALIRPSQANPSFTTRSVGVSRASGSIRGRWVSARRLEVNGTRVPKPRGLGRHCDRVD